MGLLTWLSLLFLAVAVIGSAAFLVVRGLALWRTMKEVGGAFGEAIAAVERSAATAEARAAKLDERTARLQEALERLEASRAQLAVLSDAAGEVGDVLKGVGRAVPTK